MENRFDFSSAPSSPPNFDGTFLLESTEDETKQDENELLEMDANNFRNFLIQTNICLLQSSNFFTEDGRRRIKELLKINEQTETEKEDQKAEIARLKNILEEGGARNDVTTLGLQTVEEGGSRNDDTTLGSQTTNLQSETLEDGGARSLGLQTKQEKKSICRPKKGRKSANFTVPSKGAQSSKAMRRSQSNYAKINKTVSKEASGKPLSKLKMLENENNKLRMEIEELRKQLNKDEVKCPKANPAPNLKDVTVQAKIIDEIIDEILS